MRKMIVLIALCAGALAACGQGSTGAPAAGSQPTAAQPAPVAVPTAAPQPTDLPEPSAGPSRPGGGLSIRPPDELVEGVQRQLAAYLKLGPDQLTLQSANLNDWADGSLGCPQEGMAYPQVITPGFLLVFTDAAQTSSYEVHTAMSAEQAVLCQDNRPIDLSSAPGPAVSGPSSGVATPAGTPAEIDATARPLVDLARAELAKELGVKGDDISPLTIEQVEWSDSSLGCPTAGMNYLQVVTPGYRITLQAQGKTYEYHTDSASRVVQCVGPRVR